MLEYLSPKRPLKEGCLQWHRGSEPITVFVAGFDANHIFMAARKCHIWFWEFLIILYFQSNACFWLEQHCVCASAYIHTHTCWRPGGWLLAVAANPADVCVYWWRSEKAKLCSHIKGAGKRGWGRKRDDSEDHKDANLWTPVSSRSYFWTEPPPWKELHVCVCCLFTDLCDVWFMHLPTRPRAL